MRVGKWTILTLACMVTFGAYYSFDTPSVLHNQMYRHFKTEDETQKQFETDFSLIYSVYSLPNTVIPLIGGLLVDRFGNKNVMLAFGFFVLLGNLVQTSGCLAKNISTYIFGRFLFGFGAETLGVCANTIISKWFRGQELAFALAINLSVCKLASVLNDWISPTSEKTVGLNATSALVSTLCLICYLITIVLNKVDPNDGNESINNMTSTSNDQFDEENNSQFELTNIQSYESNYEKYQTTENSLQYIKYNMNEQIVEYKVIPNNNTNVDNNNINISNAKHNTNNINASCACLSSIAHLSLPVWLIFILTLMLYGIFVPFNNISNPILLEFYFEPSVTGEISSENEVTAAWLQSIPYFLSVFVNPVLGISIDWFGHRTAQITVSIVLLITGHSLIYAHNAGPIIPLCMVGLAYSVFASVIWPCIPLVVIEEHTGTAFGIMAAFQNTGQFVVPLILQELYKRDGSYLSSEVFFIQLSIVALLLSFVLFYIDYKYYHAILMLPSANTMDNCNNSNIIDPIEAAGHEQNEYKVYNNYNLNGNNNNNLKNSNGQYLNNGSNNGNSSGKQVDSNNNSSRMSSKNNSNNNIHGLYGSQQNSPESQTSSVNEPIAIIAIPKTTPTHNRSPIMLAISGQFPISDSLELRRQISERSRLLPSSYHNTSSSIFESNNTNNSNSFNNYFNFSPQQHNNMPIKYGSLPSQSLLSKAMHGSNNNNSYNTNNVHSSPEFQNRKKLTRTTSFRDIQNKVF